MVRRCSGEFGSQRNRRRDEPLPVEEWLVATEPGPWPIEFVPSGEVRVHWVGWVMRVETFNAVHLIPVAVIDAGCSVSRALLGVRGIYLRAGIPL